MKKILKNPYILSIISKSFGVVIGLLFTIFQARYLGPGIKGQVATVNSIISITSIIFGFGVYHAYPYYRRNTNSDILPIFLKIALLMLIIYSTISAIIISLFHFSSKVYAVIMITPFITYDGIVSYITLIEVPNKKSMTDIGVLFLELLLLVTFWFFAKPSFIIGVLIISSKSVAKAILFTFWWRKKIFIQSESLVLWIPRIVKFGFFPMLSLLMTTLNYRLDVIMLNGKVADAAIGVYSIGVLLSERIWLIPDALKGIMASKITKGKDAKETAFVIRISNTICFFIAICIVLLGKEFLNYVFGSTYEGAYQVTLILLVGVFSMIYYKLIASYNIVMGKQLISFVFLCIGVVINVFANLVLIPLMGIYGAGLSSVISYSLCSVFFIVYFCSSTKISFFSMLFINRDDYSRIKTVIFRKERKLE